MRAVKLTFSKRKKVLLKEQRRKIKGKRRHKRKHIATTWNVVFMGLKRVRVRHSVSTYQQRYTQTETRLERDDVASSFSLCAHKKWKKDSFCQLTFSIFETTFNARPKKEHPSTLTLNWCGQFINWWSFAFQLFKNALAKATFGNLNRLFGEVVAGVRSKSIFNDLWIF